MLLDIQVERSRQWWDIWVWSLEGKSGLELRIWEHLAQMGWIKLQVWIKSPREWIKEEDHGFLRCCKIKRLGSLWRTVNGDWGEVHWGKGEKRSYFSHCQNWLMLMSRKRCLPCLVKVISFSIGGSRNYGTLPRKKNLALKKCTKEKTSFKHT